MSDTAVEIPFADGLYRFWLPMPQLIELERGAGQPGQPKSIFRIYDEIGAGLGRTVDAVPVYVGGGSPITNDIREVVRLGLVGGGRGYVDGIEKEVGPLAARALVDAYIYPVRPIIEAMDIAWAVLHAAINGVNLKKKAADAQAPTKAKRSRKAKSSPTAAPSA